MPKTWDIKRQLGELIGELRGLRTGQRVHLPGNITIGVVAMGRGGGGSRERRFAVVRNGRAEYYRSATEAAVNGVNLSKQKQAQQQEA